MTTDVSGSISSQQHENVKFLKQVVKFFHKGIEGIDILEPIALV
jgi:hypothetical protein